MKNASLSPGQIVWLKLRRNRTAMFGLALLIVLYVGMIFAGFFAPEKYDHQHRELGWHPPHLTRVHLFDDEGTFHGPFVYGHKRVHPAIAEYEEHRDEIVPIDFFVRGDTYALVWVFETNVHFMGSRDPERPLFLFGSDQYGRDVLSRLFYGSQVSLSVGIIGILISMSLGLFLGGVAGYFGGRVDFVLMRIIEVILSIPGLYLILTLRQAFGQDLPSTQSYFMIVLVLAFVGWAANARVVRGMVLAIKENDYVTAAEALGVSRARIIIKHILPNTFSFAIVTATLYVPYYILSEVALSFLGVGIQEPDASWGNMLKDAQNVRNLTDYPWVLTPGYFIFLAAMAFNYVGDGLRDAADPRSKV
ncbi:MAG: ABC transporter permease [Myxococcales bacterium]|nr:ABC transporter permease [Myxococcales bacterium]